MMLNKRVDSIDSLRGVAILMVLLYHVHAWMPGLDKLPSWYMFPVSLGFSGVDLFFVLSGFSLYYAWLRQARTREVDVKKYYWRRFWRIYPPYIIAFFVPLIPLLLSAPQEALGEALWHIFLLHNYSETYFYGVNGPLWSIAVEAQFYVLFPVVVLLIRRWGVTPVVVSGIILALIYRTGIYLYFNDLTYRQVPKPYLQGFWLARIPNFLLGILLASAWIKRGETEKTDARHKGLSLLIAGIVTLVLTWIIIYYFRHASMIIREFGFALGYVLIVYGVLKGALQSILKVRWLLFTGKISFSLYLTHAPIMLLLGNYLRKILGEVSIAHGFLAMAIAIIVSYGIAFLFYRWIEIPFFNKAKTYH